MKEFVLKYRNLVLSLTALLSGLFFDFLFVGEKLGISVAVFVLFLLSLFVISFFLSGKRDIKSLWLVLPILFFSFVSAIRANLFLNFLNILAVLGLLLLLSRNVLDLKVSAFTIKNYLSTLFIFPLLLLREGLRTLSGINKYLDVKTKDSYISKALVGFLFAVPFLLVFIVLFAGADLAFKKYFDSILNFHLPENWQQHLFIVVFIGLTVLGFLANAFKDKVDWLTGENKAIENASASKSVEVMVFLSLIGGLFFVFIIFQIAYLFGGERNIAELGFTYAQYARQGFWELIAVAILTLLLLLISEKFSNNSAKKDSFYIIPAMAVISEVLVIVVSAFMRLGLYVEAYGETTLRFYVNIFIWFLFVVFIILGIRTVLRKAESFFAFGVLMSLIIFTVMIDVLNPDAYIVRKNVEHYIKNGQIDIEYFRNMSPDAVPEILSIKHLLNASDQSRVDEILIQQRDELEVYKESSWRSYNHSKDRAINLLENIERNN